VQASPLLVEVDPEFDLFRLLDPRETAPSIGQVFGDPAIIAVLPADLSAAEKQQYEQLMEAWRSDVHNIEFVSEQDIKELPADRGVWLLGQNNRFFMFNPSLVERL
jgi:aminopeptidase N